MVLVRNVKFGHVFIFHKIGQKNVFDNTLETKNAFRTEKREVKKIKKLAFLPKMLDHGFCQKYEIGPCFYFSQN